MCKDPRKWVAVEMAIPVLCTFDRGLLYFDQAQKSFAPIQQVFPGLQPASKRIHDVYQNSDGIWWIGTENGISLYNSLQDTTYSIKQLHGGDELGIYAGTFVVLRIIKDRHGVMWIGTNRGLYQYHPLNRRFQSIYFPQEDILRGKVLSGVALSDSSLLINGIDQSLQYNVHTQAYQSIVLSEQQEQIPFYLMIRDEQNRIWGGSDKQVYQYYPRGHQLEARFQLRDTSIVAMVVADILPQADQLFISQNFVGVFKAQLQPANLELFPGQYQTLLIGLPGGEIWHNPGQILARLDPQTGRSDPLSFQIGDSCQKLQLGLDHQIIDQEGMVWIYSTEKKLYKIDPQSLRAEKILGAAALNHERVEKMLYTSNHRIWFLTGQSLWCYAMGSGQLHQFTEADGLLRKNISGGKLICTGSHLILAHTHGISQLNLDQFQIQCQRPAVQITNLVMDSVHHAFPQKATALSFGHQNRSLDIYFQSDNHVHAHQNRYWYRLDGFDANWYEAKERPMAHYGHLGPGQYFFRVRSANHDGIMGPESGFAFSIRLPWWETTSSRLIALGFLLIMVFGFIRLRTRQMKRQQHILEKRVLQRTQALSDANHHLMKQNEEIIHQKEHIKQMSEQLHQHDQLQLRFFANISHEFKTPLTLIMTPIEMLRAEKSWSEERVKPFLTSIHQNAHRLYSLIEQLLDFRKIQHTPPQLHPSLGDLRLFLQKLSEGFLPLAERRRLQYHVQNEVPEGLFSFDPDVLEKILNNLLSNAFKYTPEGQRIDFQ
ncbi:MAG: histidine kinase dimerization/phospho-acceptor domain-containing protein, partial [Bacteroidota bacterium]